MNIRPVAHPSQIVQTQSSEQGAKARAVAAFKSASAPQTPAPQQNANHPAALDQNAIGVEDLGSIQIPKPNLQTQEPDKSTDIEASSEETETTQEPEKQEPDPALSRQFAQMARQEKALRAKAQQQEQAWAKRDAELKARETALTQQSQAPSVDLTKYISKDRLMQDPLSALAEAGTNYDEITQRVINRQPVDPMVQQTIDKLEAKIAALEKNNEEGKKSAIDQQTAQYQAAVKQISMDAKALIKSDPVAYEAIIKTGTVKDVVKLIEDTYNKDGILLSVEEAANEVENYLVEENYNMATKIEKIRKRIGQVAPAQAPAKTSPVAPQQSQMKTLTNAASASRPLTARERAIAAFSGKLK